MKCLIYGHKRGLSRYPSFRANDIDGVTTDLKTICFQFCSNLLKNGSASVPFSTNAMPNYFEIILTQPLKDSLILFVEYSQYA